MTFEGVLLEKALENPRGMVVVDVAQDVPKRWMDDEKGIEEKGTDHEGHDEYCRDPHTWLSPAMLKIEARNVAEGLCRIDAEHANDYRRNLAALLDRIDATHRRIAKTLAPYRGRSFYIFHPSFGYFADAYGLKEESIQSGGQQPSAKQLRSLMEKARSEGVTTIFIQPQFSPQSAETVARQLGGRVVTINDLAKDVLGNLEEVAGKMEAAFRESGPERRSGEWRVESGE